MSNSINTDLLDRASDMVEYWEGTLHAELIRQALDSNDLDQLRQYVVAAEREANTQEEVGDDSGNQTTHRI